MKHFTTFAAAVLAAALSGPAAAQLPVLQRCDAAAADAERMFQAVTECASALAASRAALASAGAQTSGPEERVETSSTPLSVELTKAAMSEPLHGRLLSYYAYDAFAAGDPSRCSALAPIGAAQENLCRRAVADLGFVRARYAPAPELVKACRRTDSPDGREGPASPCCSLLGESIKSASPCARLSPRCFDAPACAAFFSSAAGSAADCRRLPPPPPEDCKGAECARLQAERVASCEADAAFARANKSGKLEDCAGSERCRALMGAGKAVAQEIAAKDLKNPAGAWFVKSGWKIPSVVARSRGPVKPQPAAPPTAVPRLDFKGFVCAEPMVSNDNRAAAAAAVNTARVCLKDAEAATTAPGKALAEEIDARQEKLIRLGMRLEKHFEGGKPAKAAAPK